MSSIVLSAWQTLTHFTYYHHHCNSRRLVLFLSRNWGLEQLTEQLKGTQWWSQDCSTTPHSCPLHLLAPLSSATYTTCGPRRPLIAALFVIEENWNQTNRHHQEIIKWVIVLPTLRLSLWQTSICSRPIEILEILQTQQTNKQKTSFFYFRSG